MGKTLTGTDCGQVVRGVEHSTEMAAKIQPLDASVPFVWGLVLLHQNQKAAALAKFKQARDLDSTNWRIRKQTWAIEHPDKFYTADSPDYGWQKEELAREKSAGN